ncbi:hypothetical protein SAY86_027896 [Trapa natans]|uniref:Transcription factor CBF/NF-Y/archaeal histone domain-containing protein n=1 Tax=Trapa natans TaxID=22666 RepID=A0AAN7LYU0_TRANT|nr:hypothetical protein SAY86_027896 [Trapa natans]
MDEQDRMLPIAIVGRIMKQVLPPAAKISKEAKQTMQECSTEFISFVTGEASARCQKENRKTVNGDDICWALSSLGFDHYAQAMTRYLQRYRDHERDKPASATSALIAAAYQPTGTISKDQGHWLDQKEMDLNAEEAPVPPLSSKAVHTLEFRIINERN